MDVEVIPVVCLAMVMIRMAIEAASARQVIIKLKANLRLP